MLLLLSCNMIFAEEGGPAFKHVIGMRTGAELHGTFGVRSLNEVKYEATMNRHLQAGAGFLLAPGWSLLTAYNLEIGYEELFTPQLSVHLKFLNRVYHEFQVGENSVIPYLSWKDKHFEVDLGYNPRFANFGPDNLNLVFYYPGDLIQHFLFFRFAAYLVFEKPGLRLGLEMKNSDWNYAGNSFEASFHLDAIYQVSQAWSLQFNIGTTPSGFSGLSIALNRFNFLAGAQYKL